MSYLVTAALGAVGAWTLRALIDRGHEPVSFDPGASDHRLRLALTPDELAAVPRVDGDVADLGQLARVIDEYRIERVIHLAALLVALVVADPIRGANVNVTGTVNIFELARRHDLEPVVYVSSIAAATAGEPFRIAFGGSLRLEYVADAGMSFVAASEVKAPGASVHNLDGPVASIPEVIAAIEHAAPEARGLMTAADEPLPFDPAPDSSSFVELIGGSISRPLLEGVADTLAQLRA